MKSKAIKQISVFLCLTMLATLMFSAPISAETGSAIISILSGDEIALGETLKVSADIPSFTNKAELYLDDTSVAEISEEDTDATYIFSATVPESETIGTKTIKLVVDGEIVDTAVVEVYKKTMQGSNNWYQDFDTGFTEDSADSVNNASYSGNLANGTATGYIEGIFIDDDNVSDKDAISLAPNSYCKYYVGSLNGNVSMTGQFSEIQKNYRSSFNPFAKRVGEGLYEFSFNIAIPADVRIGFTAFKGAETGGTSLTQSLQYDISGSTTSGQFLIEKSLEAAGESFEVLTPYNVRFVIDMESGIYKIFIKDILCQYGSINNDFSTNTLNTFKVEISGYYGARDTWKALSDEEKLFYIDDFKSTNYSTTYAPKVTSLSCDEETLVLSDAVIEVGAETITAVMDTELSSATAYIADATGEKIADAVVSDNTVTIDGSAITKDGEYAIVVNSTVSQASAKTLIPFKAYYVGAEEFLVGTSLEIDGNDVHGYFEAVNSGEASQNVKFIVCTYNDNELLDLTILPLEVKAGDKADEKVEFIDSSANRAKVMLWWDSLTEITPIIDYEYATFRTQQ